MESTEKKLAAKPRGLIQNAVFAYSFRVLGAEEVG